jgi:hypothetical protein
MAVRVYAWSRLAMLYQMQYRAADERSFANDFRCRLAAAAYRSSFVGTQSGNRQQRYKKFHSGASFPVKINMFPSFDFVRSGKLVDKALNLPLLVRGYGR